MKFVAGKGTEAEQIHRAVCRAWREAQRNSLRERSVLVTLSSYGRAAYLHSVDRGHLELPCDPRMPPVTIAGARALLCEGQVDPFEIWVTP